jgi:hypothetical protein
MPRTVRVAVLTSWILILLGVANLAVSIADLVTGDSVCTALGLCRARGFLGSFSAMAAAVPVAVARRDARLRESAFHFALFVALLVGFVALGALVLGVLAGFSAALLVPVFMFALATVLAWSLSRPSAKAWFTPGRAEPSGLA